METVGGSWEKSTTGVRPANPVEIDGIGRDLNYDEFATIGSLLNHSAPHAANAPFNSFGFLFRVSSVCRGTGSSKGAQASLTSCWRVAANRIVPWRVVRSVAESERPSNLTAQKGLALALGEYLVPLGRSRMVACKCHPQAEFLRTGMLCAGAARGTCDWS